MGPFVRFELFGLFVAFVVCGRFAESGRRDPFDLAEPVLVKIERRAAFCPDIVTWADQQRRSRAMKTKKEPIGAHWNETKYSKLYQLYRRVEDVATALEKRRQGGWVPSKPYIEELYDIAIQLKVLDKKVQS